MTMGNEAVTTIVMRAEDEASQAIDRTRRSVDNMDQNVTVAQRTGTQTSGAFLGLTRQIVALGGAGLGLAGIFGGVKGAMSDTAKSAAALQFVTEGIGPAGEESLSQLESSFRILAQEFATTESTVEGVFNTLIKDGGRGTVTLRELRGALALARATGIDFAQAADVVSAAMQGNLEPLSQLTGPQGLKTLNEAFERSIEIAPEAITWFDRLSAATSQLFEDVVRRPGDVALQALLPKAIWEPLLAETITPIGTSARTQAIQQAQINLNVTGTVIMNEDQRREFARELQRLLDENDRRR